VSVYEDVTNQIVSELEKGVAPWVKPWRCTMPMNFVSGREYRGINVMLLWGRSSFTKKDGAEDREEKEIHFLKFYWVFNLEQTEGIPHEAKEKPTIEPIEHAKAFLERVGANVSCNRCQGQFSERDSIAYFEEDIPLPQKKMVIKHVIEKGYCSSCKEWSASATLPVADVILGN